MKTVLLRKKLRAILPTWLFARVRKIIIQMREIHGHILWMYDRIRLELTYRGQKPGVFFPISITRTHPAWQTYVTYPPLQYSPYRVAELCHWINQIPQRPEKPCVSECEHILALAGNITDWQWGLQRLDLINRLVEQEQCKFVFTYSAGLVKHSRRYLRPELWHKLGYLYSVFPPQAEYPRPVNKPFTILTIASRFSDKGVPEALLTYQVLRSRHGADVQMILVSQAVPLGYRLPEGVICYDTPRMSEQLKKHVYQSAQLLLLPCYSDGTGCIIEAYAFGVPVITTRIHHDDEFLQNGVTGYLIDAPVYAYSENYGVRWKTWQDFLGDLEAMRERGEFRTVVDQSVDRLEMMMSGQADLAAMGSAARLLHAKYFSPQARNDLLVRLYSAALNSETHFPSYPD